MKTVINVRMVIEGDDLSNLSTTRLLNNMEQYGSDKIFDEIGFGFTFKFEDFQIEGDLMALPDTLVVRDTVVDQDGDHYSGVASRVLLDLREYGDDRVLVLIGDCYWLYTGYALSPISDMHLDKIKTIYHKDNIKHLTYSTKGEFIK